MSQSQFALQVRDLTAAEYFAKRLADHRKPIVLSADPAHHLEQLRAHLIESHVDCVIIGRGPGGKPETYAECFERHYGEPLHPKKSKGRKHAETSL